MSPISPVADTYDYALDNKEVDIIVGAGGPRRLKDGTMTKGDMKRYESFTKNKEKYPHVTLKEIESQEDIKGDKSSLLKAVITVMLADVTMSLDNVISVAGAAKGHYFLLIFGLVLSIALMAFMANLIAKWIKTYKWIAWVGLIAILIVAIELIYADVKLFI